MSSAAQAVPQRRGLLAGVSRWLEAMPHPPFACEIGARHVAAVRYARRGPGLEDFAAENLPDGAVAVSPVELNLADAGAVRAAAARVLRRVEAHGQQGTLLVPDPVVRVFLLSFDTFPKSNEEAIPLLRWRLKKSVPFEADDTVVSYMRQPGPGNGLSVLAAVARQRLIRQYEEVAAAAGLVPGVVLSSTLATLPLIEDPRPTLLVRRCGATLTSALVRGDVLCVYRCAELSAAAGASEEQFSTQDLLDEVYPAVAYYQDTWGESLAAVRLAGMGARFEEIRGALAAELGCEVSALALPAALAARGSGDARALLERNLESLAGWMMNRWAQ